MCKKNGGGAAGLVLLILLFTVSSAFAQEARYVDLVNGADTDDCNFNDPCTLSRAWAQQTNGDQFFIRVRRTGGTVEVPAPATSLSKEINFAPYLEGDVNAVEGTLEFTGNLKIASTGQFILHSKAKAQFEDITLESGSRSKAVFRELGDEAQISITGTLTIPDGETAVFEGGLVVSRSFTLKGGTKAGKASRLQIGDRGDGDESLTVQSGATLRIDGVDLMVHVRQEFTVDGVIEDVTKGASHPILIAFLNTAGDPNPPGSRKPVISTFLRSDLYLPLSNGFDQNDCKRIRGKGTISAGIFAIAMGNVCVELKRVGPITVSGSLANDVFTGHKVTTDLIFREDVIVDGDVAQWNDSRIVFEKTATIRGDVILRDGGTPYTNTDDYGEANTAADSGIRHGWKVSDNKYTCEYSNAVRRDSATRDGGVNTVHIPGIHFAGEATIEGDLNVYSITLAETTEGATADATQCAPRVLFMAPLAKTDGDKEVSLSSSVGGDLVVEDIKNFGDKGRVYLDTDSLKTGADVRKTAHNLRIGGDLAAGGKTIGMGYPSMSSVDGMCMENNTRLSFGNHLMLTDAAESVVIGDATSGLTLDALVTYGDLRVEPGKGSLTVTTLHVGPDAELMSTKDVKVTESLILQGELSGELEESSTIKTLTYGSRNTDLVKKAALVDMLEALSISVGNGELRLDEMVKTKNLGLCSGTLSLVDVESTTDSTLHVTEQITVQNGMLGKDTNDPGSISTDKAGDANMNDRYILKYITPGPRTAMDALEWFDPRDVIVDHAKAEITATGDHSLAGKLTISNGKLTVDGDLTVGTSTLHRTASSTNAQDALAQVNKYSVLLTAGELHTRGQDVTVHGKVTVSGKSKLMTGGGDLQVLGRVSGGNYVGKTAQVTVEKDAMMDLGAGTLMLGPADTAKRDGLADNTTMPTVDLMLTGKLLADTLYIPKGSKRTHIASGMLSKAHTHTFGVVRFDGGKTPNDQLANNASGHLFFNWVATGRGTDTGTTTVLDSLAMTGEGYVGFHGKKLEIKKAVHVRSGQIWLDGGDFEFKDDLKLSGTGKLDVRWSTTLKRNIRIHGDLHLTNDTGMEDRNKFPGPSWGNLTTMTVMGDLTVGPNIRYISSTQANLIVHGDVQYDKIAWTIPILEFQGKEVQTVTMSANPKSVLGNIIVDNPKGILLGSDVRQHSGATLTLRRGKIRSMPADSMYKWVLQNAQVEEELRGRLSAQEGNACGSDSKQKCKASILRGSGQSYAVATPIVRHLLQGNAGTGAESGGYLFPVGREEGNQSYYRPMILQLPSDLNDKTVATISPILVPDGEIPAWPAENIVIPTTGGSLTLDVHADIFWKIQLTDKDDPEVKKELPTNANIRMVADGIQNVADVKGLRIVQWDCEWKNPKLAGRLPAQTGASSFAVNGYINGVLNLTQEGIGLGSCAILGVAANGVENPIDLADLSGGRAMVQFIHNLPGSGVVDLHLGETRIGNGLSFRRATAYRPVGTGNLTLTIQPVGAPEEQGVTYILSLANDKSYGLIVHGNPADPRLKVLEMRTVSSVSNKADVILVHGSPDLGAASVQVMDPMDPTAVVMALTNRLMLDEATRRYVSLDPSVQVMQVRSTDEEVEAVYELDLHGYADHTLVLNLSGTRQDLTILGVDRDGKIVPVQMVTGTEEEGTELPKEFVLHGNYPNPFNPSTRIQFDLPEHAQVQIQIVDLLGREVMVLPAQEMEAGANRSIELHASSLASGTYLYRLVVTGAESWHVQTGRMMLVK